MENIGNQQPAAELEVIPAEKPQLAIPDGDKLPPSLVTSIRDNFGEFFDSVEKWREQALAIRVTSLDQKTEMKLARTLRLELKNVRTAAEKARKQLKENCLIMGRAIDGTNNLLLAALKPLEDHLEEQEKYAERLAAEQLARKLRERTDALAPYIEPGQVIPDLAALDDAQWAKYLDDAKLLYEARLEAARKAEADRIAKEQAERAERERLRQENERLAKEKAEAERKAAEERARLEAERKAEIEAYKQERLAAEEAARKEREAAEAKARAEREAAEKARKEAAEKARKERERLEAEKRAIEEKARKEREEAERKAAKEREEAAAKAKAEREAAEAKAAEERAAREKIEAELRAKQEQEEKARKEREEAERKAAAAPDKAKLLGIAKSVRSLEMPQVSTDDGKRVLADIKAKAESFAKWIETQIATLS